jgi:hypothetical protein
MHLSRPLDMCLMLLYCACHHSVPYGYVVVTLLTFTLCLQHMFEHHALDFLLELCNLLWPPRHKAATAH